MKTLLLFAAACAFVTATAVAQSTERQERISASFLLAFGRAPSPAELEQGSQHRATSVGELVERHRQTLQSDAAAKRAVALKAFHDAYGRAPTDAELNGATSASTYTELVRGHLRTLASQPEEYARVLDRAYQLVIRRGVYPEEIDYWKKYDPLSFALLVGCIENWARRNQPGLMVTAGTPTISVNSEFLVTARLSPAVASEARAAIGQPADSSSDAKTAGYNIVAPGAEKIVSSGRIHFAAAGAPQLVPVRSQR